MKKFWKKAAIGAMCLSLSAITLFSTACGRRGETEVRDPDKIQIECAIADVGLGTEWLYNLKARFEKDYPNVQIIPNIVTSELESNAVASTMASSNYDIAFVNTGISDMDNIDGTVLDVTDLVTKKAFDANGNYVGNGGTVSLEDRMKKYDGYLDCVAQKKDGRNTYQSLPYYIAPYGCWYDVDLFEKEGYFEVVDYVGVDGIAGTEDDRWGADGIEGTYDDNLPATFSDYQLLIQTIAADGLTPYTWSGVHTWMRTFYLNVVYMNYEGKADYALNWTLSGTEDQENIGEVTLANSYKLINQDGRKAALKMANFMTSSTSYFSGDAFMSSQTHLEAQRDFLGSAQRAGSKQIAMILDGGWWENEAKSYMNEMAADKGDKYAFGTRRFGYMPVPRFEADESIGMGAQKNTTPVLSVERACDLIVNKKVENASAEKREAIETFLLYMQSYASIKDFSATTGIIRPVECYFTDEDLQGFTYMAQQVYELLNTCDLFFVTAEMDDNAAKYDAGSGWFYDSVVKGTLISEPMLAFAENGYSVKEYLAGQKVAHTEEEWNKKVSK